jgi:xylose isomerase
LTFKVYDPNRIVLGKRMEDQLRIGVCLWHSFNWPGSDVFGLGTFDRPWLDSQRGAHLLLQVRTHVLNDDLAVDFQR